MGTSTRHSTHRGAIHFLKKPFEMRELESALQGLSPVETLFHRTASIIRVPMLDTILVETNIDTAHLSRDHIRHLYLSGSKPVPRVRRS